MAAAIGPVGPPPSGRLPRRAPSLPRSRPSYFGLRFAATLTKQRNRALPPPDVSAPVRPSAVTSRGERRLARLYLCLVPLTPPSTPPHALSPAFGRAVLRVLTGARVQGQEHG